jgi:hypothetical protein
MCFGLLGLLCRCMRVRLRLVFVLTSWIFFLSVSYFLAVEFMFVWYSEVVLFGIW